MNLRTDRWNCSFIIDLILMNDLEISGERFSEKLRDTYLRALSMKIPQINGFTFQKLSNGGYKCLDGNRRLESIIHFHAVQIRYTIIEQRNILQSYVPILILELTNIKQR